MDKLIQVTKKGNMRIKNSKKKNISTKTKQEINYKQYIDSINKKLLTLNKTNYSVFENVLTGIITQCFKDLKREYINKKYGLKYSDMNKLGLDYIYTYFFYKLDNVKLLLKSNIYEYIMKNFKNNGRKVLFDFIDSIDKLLVKKEYKIDLESSKYNFEEFSRALEYFDLEMSSKVHFKTIKEKYIEYLDVPDYNKDNTNMYFTLIKNQYNEYLKNY